MTIWDYIFGMGMFAFLILAVAWVIEIKDSLDAFRDFKIPPPPAPPFPDPFWKQGDIQERYFKHEQSGLMYVQLYYYNGEEWLLADGTNGTPDLRAKAEMKIEL